jgi:ubiquinone/menaquinone biosynthesis C-methylase UbiE
VIDRLILEQRTDVSIQGIDVLVRQDTPIPVSQFDGVTIPFSDASFDVVMFVDVLHHTVDPFVLLKEAQRVAGTVLIKDHFRDGFLSRTALRLMDWVGNAHHGVALPYNYWSRFEWAQAFAELQLKVGATNSRLGLYTRPASWIFERGLHFVAILGRGEVRARSYRKSERCENLLRRMQLSNQREPGTIALRGSKPAKPQHDAWEAAYLAFETPEQEIHKFVRRLIKLGAPHWPRDAQIVELFCGRGNGLHALRRLGFTNIEGVDLSPSLLAQYRGDAKCHVSDCRQLPFQTGSKDVLIVQGGLHHLSTLPDDLEQVFAEMHRVLRAGGWVVIVEPWLDPFLRLVHAVSGLSLACFFSKKLNALATMIRYERRTYEQWLNQPKLIRSLSRKHFSPLQERVGWGKWNFVGMPRG